MRLLLFLCNCHQKPLPIIREGLKQERRERVDRLLLCCSFAASLAQRDFSQVEIATHRLADNLYYLEGQGGNIGVSVGEDGVFLIDDQFAPLTEKILAAIRVVTDQPVVTYTADGRGYAGFGQAFAITDRQILRTAVTIDE